MTSRGNEPYIPRIILQFLPNMMRSTLIHVHCVVPIKSRSVLKYGSTRSSRKELFPNLGANARMAVSEQQVQKGLPLIFSNIIAISLRKNQQTLVPNDG